MKQEILYGDLHGQRIIKHLKKTLLRKRAVIYYIDDYTNRKHKGLYCIYHQGNKIENNMLHNILWRAAQ